jgi:polyferredoxin
MTARYVQPLRIFTQFGFLTFMLWLGIRFNFFVSAVRNGTDTSVALRPDGIEGFLPISGLLGTVSWIKGGGINQIHPAAVVIFVTVLLLALLLRRSFCSWICPVAVVSECSWKTGFKLLRRNVHLPYWLDCCLRSLKYLLLAFFIYSVVIAMSPEAMQSFINSDYHKAADVRLLDFFMNISHVALGVILFLLALSFLLKNPFCRFLCPYGALLGLIASLSPVRVTRNTDRCVSCGVCSQVCPTSIDVMHKKSVASPECIGCWRCVSHCRVNQALSMNVAGRYAIPGFIFGLLVVLILWGGSFVGKATGNWHTKIDLNEYRRLVGR